MNATDAIVALVIGVAFGFALERAGLGSARKLAGQFLLRDFTVIKVMFTAIVTAMLGIFWLGRLGVIDAAFLYVPDTYLAPQAAGGVLFGAGFALAGLCPGTSCVSAATGRGDGLAVVFGLFAGVTTIGLFFAPVQAFYESGARGAWTLPALLHLAPGAVVLLVVAVALLLFAAVERFAAARAVVSDRASIRRTPVRRWLAWSALALGVAAAVDGLAAGSRQPSPPAPLVRPHSGC
jgi:uncharacterized membrane protein YedE/YeeE